MNLKKIVCYLGIHSLKPDKEYNDCQLKNRCIELYNPRLTCNICGNYCDYDGGVF